MVVLAIVRKRKCPLSVNILQGCGMQAKGWGNAIEGVLSGSGIDQVQHQYSFTVIKTMDLTVSFTRNAFAKSQLTSLTRIHKRHQPNFLFLREPTVRYSSGITNTVQEYHPRRRTTAFNPEAPPKAFKLAISLEQSFCFVLGV